MGYYRVAAIYQKLIQILKLLFFPESILSIEVYNKWLEETKKRYISLTNNLLWFLSALALLHFFFIDLLSNFQNKRLFFVIRISWIFLSVSAIILSSRISHQKLFRIPYIIALSWFTVGQVILMHYEPSIPFFIAIIFLVFSPAFMGLSIGFSLIAASLLYMICGPMLVAVVPNVHVPLYIQMSSNYLIILLIVGGSRLVYNKDINIFLLNERNIELQSKLMDSNKMKILGTMSSGLAHELLNNLNYAWNTILILEKKIVLIEDQEKKSKIEELIKRINLGISKSIDVCKDFKIYSGNDKFKPRKMLLKVTLLSSIRMLKHRAEEKGVSLSGNIRDDLVFFGNETALHQAFINLIVNAIDATPKGRSVEVTAEIKGNKYDIKIIDTGTGIPVDIQERIYDPFFTTKDVGLGTGLGLSLVKGTIDSHKGNISFETKIGVGTTFIISLPILEKLTKEAA